VNCVILLLRFYPTDPFGRFDLFGSNSSASFQVIPMFRLSHPSRVPPLSRSGCTNFRFACPLSSASRLPSQSGEILPTCLVQVCGHTFIHMKLSRQCNGNWCLVKVFYVQCWASCSYKSSRSHSVTFTFRLLTISGGSSSSAQTLQFLLVICSSDYRIPFGVSHLVVQGVFRLPPCCPLLEFQVNQRNFYVRTPVLFTDVNCVANLGASNTQLNWDRHLYHSKLVIIVAIHLWREC